MKEQCKICNKEFPKQEMTTMEKDNETIRVCKICKVREWQNQHSIVIPKGGRIDSFKLSKEQTNYIIKNYYNHSAKEIAEKLMITVHKVNYCLKKHNIKKPC